MDATREDLVRLTKEWMDVIGRDHHKDRDCHFDIEHRYSYGKNPNWYAVHYGYIIDPYDEKFATYQEALSYHIRVLEREIDVAKARQELSDG